MSQVRDTDAIRNSTGSSWVLTSSDERSLHARPALDLPAFLLGEIRGQHPMGVLLVERQLRVICVTETTR